ncbi:hypothetical protein OGATHE_004789 [Ogataea polymorpha]|uniref:Uncharacterized protein n=1 Tax=Ogataea polymorpha TaxID=460523 RepID=A0A9P8T1V8_9ASCO|nr:hypothetical protein OGATHE_004789 [Ogataea polymorpha]
MVNSEPSLVRADGAVETLERVALELQIVADDVKNAHHLGENEHAMAVSVELVEQLVQKHHFSRRHNQALEDIFSRVRAHLGQHVLLDAVKQVRVVRGLFQLGHDIEQRDLRPARTLVQGAVVLGEDVLVVLGLDIGELDSENTLGLAGERRLDVFFESAQDEGLDGSLERLDVALGLGIRRVEVDLLVDLELARHQEVAERSQFLEVVLQGSSRDEQSIGHLKLAQTLVERALGVFQPVRLVDSQILPLEASQLRTVLQNVLVRRQKHIELDLLAVAANVELVVTDRLSGLGVAHVVDHVDVRSPLIEGLLPRRHRRQRHDHQMRAVLPSGVDQPRQKRHCLDGLSEPHLIGKNAVLVA